MNRVSCSLLCKITDRVDYLAHGTHKVCIIETSTSARTRIVVLSVQPEDQEGKLLLLPAATRVKNSTRNQQESQGEWRQNKTKQNMIIRCWSLVMTLEEALTIYFRPGAEQNMAPWGGTRNAGAYLIQ